MHRLKHQARQNAWYSDANNHNPFARYRSDTGRSNYHRDAEGAAEAAATEATGYLSPTVSQNDLTDSIHEDIYSIQPIQHAATDPAATSSRRHGTSSEEKPAVQDSSALASIHETSVKRSHTIAENEQLNQAIIKSARSPHFTIVSQFRVVFFGAWLNILLVFIPVGFAVNYTHLNARIVFALNFLAIIPSTMMISFAVDELSLRTGDIIGALLNMTFSNATQLISSILLLKSRQIVVLKTSLLGSIISNLLLMLGLCFFCGGINRIEQCFNITVAQMVAGMLFLAVISLVVPTASRLMAQGVSDHDVVLQSRGTSIVILISYGLYLFFQLKSHAAVFAAPTKKVEKRKIFIKGRLAMKGIVKTSQSVVSESEVEEEDETEQPQLSLWTGIVVLICFTVVLGFNAEFATNSIQTMVQDAKISQTFVGFVILPLLSNDVSSIANAVKDKMDLCIALTLERCMQTALLVVPLVVIIAWGMHVEQMSLEFDGFSVAATFASIIIVTYLIADGRSNWLQGALLIKVYVIVCLAAYFVQEES